MQGRARALAGFVVCLAALGVAASAFGASAVTTSPCTASRTANALTTVSSDGAVVHGSPCGDRIVVTSPLVREIVAGDGGDVIYANPDVEVVDGGAGDDVIHGDLPEPEEGASAPVYLPLPRPAGGSTATMSITEKKCEAGKSCYGGDGSQELIGSAGNDRIFGQRGNDLLFGNSGNDELFGGVGDESTISGGAGNDLLSGGLGTDILNGNQESDLVRGDGTIDTIEDTGPSGTDTLSFATAVTPGFHGAVGPSGFPADSNSEERGVNVHLDGTSCEGEFEACDNDARYGGGLDNVNVGGFESVVGSPFADVIVGSNGANQIDGGGGTDAIYGRGGDDSLFGGADGDYITGEEGTDTANGQGGADNCLAESASDCAGSAESVTQRDRSKIAVGFMVTSFPAGLNWSAVYLTGSTATDRVKAGYTLEGGIGYVTFTTEGESAPFDTSVNGASANCAYEVAKVKCTLPKPLDALTVAGVGGDDALTLEGFPETTTPVLLGGEGNDELVTGNGTEDMLVDGNGGGNDTLRAGNYDDALINNEGADSLQGGNGNDLLLSASNCDGDTLQGAASGEADGAAVNSTSWAKLPEGLPGVVADLEKGKAGNTWSGSTPACASGTTGTLANIDDLEGSSGNDQLYGDGLGNNLLGRLGKDEIYGRAGADRIEAEDGTAEVGGGGEGTDSCVLDTSDKFNSCNP
jgi:Ca2+-binding RTX toxin-like protein